MVFYFIPYAFVMNVGTFRSMDPALEEAGAIFGANLWRRLTRVTLPLMAASIGAAALFIFTLGLEQFAIPGFLGSHIRLDTLAYAIYQRTNAYPNDLPGAAAAGRSEEHTSELPSLMRTSYAVFCLTKKQQVNK